MAASSPVRGPGERACWFPSPPTGDFPTGREVGTLVSPSCLPRAPPTATGGRVSAPDHVPGTRAKVPGRYSTPSWNPDTGVAAPAAEIALPGSLTPEKGGPDAHRVSVPPRMPDGMLAGPSIPAARDRLARGDALLVSGPRRSPRPPGHHEPCLATPKSIWLEAARDAQSGIACFASRALVGESKVCHSARRWQSSYLGTFATGYGDVPSTACKPPPSPWLSVSFLFLFASPAPDRETARSRTQQRVGNTTPSLSYACFLSSGAVAMTMYDGSADDLENRACHAATLYSPAGENVPGCDFRSAWRGSCTWRRTARRTDSDEKKKTHPAVIPPPTP
ncbi:hypothetical protein B2J93_5023 [Marssonina coronariae]|uniref:Uncharacterized protein n=1 Tax=Diplocarpon coronariae TaxID=2795749 RepID=A0A218Z3X6_9HELO|nr:hypothetical protein B2J93_5023 [Marssonina coronariae]